MTREYEVSNECCNVAVGYVRVTEKLKGIILSSEVMEVGKFPDYINRKKRVIQPEEIQSLS